MSINKSPIIHLPPLLKTAADLIYDPLGYQIINLKMESESQEYSACSFKLNSLKIIYRVSKITPTKTGQFVTIWKRDKAGITIPFDEQDDFDLMIITAISEHNFGQFIFPKNTLAQQKIITKNGVGGKRGIRIYPPWDTVTNKQAEKTQQWQLAYFFPINVNQSTDLALAKKLINT